MRKTRINAILELYWFPPGGFSANMMEHIESFKRYSTFNLVLWNTVYPFPEILNRYEFDAVILHYSLFGGPVYWLDSTWKEYITSMPKSIKIAFFQDEYRHWGMRYSILDELGIDIVYTCFEACYHSSTYYLKGWRGKAIHTLTGYVDDRLASLGKTFGKEDYKRDIDIGYRARRGEEYLGKGALEKHQIGDFFLENLASSGLNLDIMLGEASRINGDNWYRFIGNCKASLGVESGASVVDTEDILWPCWRAMKSTDETQVDFEIFSTMVGLEQYEDKIPLRTISPRHFEAAAMKSCQILFKGDYSGILKPERHYLALEKDYSNFDSIMKQFLNPDVRRQLTDNAYNDLIASGLYSYSKFMDQFDSELIDKGVFANKKDIDIFKYLEKTLYEEQIDQEKKVTRGEKAWFGPDSFPRPNWPWNLSYLRDRTPNEIMQILSLDKSI